MTISPISTSVGIRIPATNGGKKCSNSCNPRKYHGALAGFGVNNGFASCSSGASQNNATTTITITSTSKTIASRTSRCGYVMSCGPRLSVTFAEVFRVMNTIRRGSFVASELNPISILAFSVIVFCPYRHAAILLHTPEMHADQQESKQRKNDYMQHIKAQQRVFSHDVSAQRNESHLTAHNRHRRNNVGSYRDSPKSQLIPWQQVARVTQKQRHQKQKNSHDPIEFMWRLVPSAIKHMEHMPENNQHHQVRRDPMHVPQKHPVRYHEPQILHVVVRIRSRRVVIKHQQHPRNDQQQKQQKR